MSESDVKPERAVTWLTLVLAIGAPAVYLLVWRLLPGDDGCGPPGHSTAGRILEFAPFGLPFAAAAILLGFAWKRRWRVPTLAWGAVTIVVISGTLEAVVLFLEIAAHNCTQ